MPLLLQISYIYSDGTESNETVNNLITEYKDEKAYLAIDDIKFSVCSPPNVDLYSNLSSFARDTTICGDTDITVGTVTSSLLESFYKNSPKFLYQQSSDGENWVNMKVVTDKEFTFNNTNLWVTFTTENNNLLTTGDYSINALKNVVITKGLLKTLDFKNNIIFCHLFSDSFP